MPDKILLKRSLTSGSIPTTASLSVGELAVNVPDGKLFLRQSGSGTDIVRSLLTVDTPMSGNLLLTGSIISTQGITGSLFGTSSWAQYAVTASYSLTQSGASGSSGTSGQSGSSGTSGSTGSSGTSGNTGSSGTSGNTGSSGTSGNTGSSGTSGNTGSSGTSGTSASVTINSNVDNYITTATGTTNTLNGEANLTFDGTLLNVVGRISASAGITGSLFGTASYALQALSSSYSPPSFIDNLVTVGLVGSSTDFTSIKTAVDSITDATAVNTYTVRVYPGVYIEDTITLKPYIAVKGDSSISTIVSASSPSSSIFVMADQSMVIDMQIQGTTAVTSSAIVYSSPTTPQTNAIAYVENVRFGTNYTNAKVVGSGSSGNCILQCSNVKYGGFTSGSKSFDVGFYVTSGSDGGIGRMQLRNVTSTNGGVAGTDNDQIFALADAPGCTFIVNGCLLTRATGTARGTAFKVYNGGQLRLTGVNFQRWIRGIWAPQTGSAPSIDAIALNFENCTTDVQIDHSGSLGKVQGTDNFLKTIINKDAPLYEVNQDPRRITVAQKGGDFSSISASVAYITDSSETNRYIIEVGPGQFTEKQIDMTNRPYVAILGSDIQTTVIVPSGSGNYDQLILGPTNEVSFLSLKGNNVAGYSAITAQNLGDDFAQAHKVSIYDYDYGVKVLASTANATFYGEYIDINGNFSYGTYVSSSNGFAGLASIENYYLFPSSSSGIGNYAVGPSSSLSLYTSLFDGDATVGSTAIKIEQGATLEAAGLDIQDWDYGLRIPAGGVGPEFRVVGSMFHNISTYDFDVQNSTTRGRFQGVSDHTKINNISEDFYWNFLDDTDGENDVTRKLSVTFADGTHTDATTLIFKGSPMGVMQGGVIVTGSGFGITAASGFGYLQDSINTDVYKRLDWIDGNLTLTANSENYIYVNDSGVLTSATSIPNNETNIILGRVVTNDTKVEFIDQTPYNGEHMSNKLSTFNREALGPVYAVGSIVTENVTPFKLNVTQGTYFFSENKFTPSGTSSVNLTQYYSSASVWARYTSSIVPSNQYASASILAPMSSSYYTKHTVYLVGDGVDEKYFLVINSNQYSTLVAAESADLPTIPTYFSDGVVPLAAVYVQSGSANITQIQDIRPIIGFRAAGVNASSVHGNLLGLDADDHQQYLLTNGGRTVTGNMNFGGNNITNVSSLTATSITGSLFGTASWAQYAVTASYVSGGGPGGSGTSGSSGTAGSSGTSGSSGSTGSSGTSGTTGSSGTSGSTGSSGTSGSTGSSGTSGSSGTDGSTGSSGTSGSTGSSGTSGSTGSSGTSGTTGSSGTSGTTGSSGTSGSTGSSGTSGTTGSSGTSGTTGSSGTSGTTGSSGTSGVSATVTINNNVDNYITTATGTTNTLNGEGNLKFNGSLLEVTGSANISSSLTVNGNTLFADATNNRVGIGTLSPANVLQVGGNVSASSYTSSLNNAVGFLGTASFAVSASWAPGGSGTVGPGTVNTLALFDTANTVSSSVITQNTNLIGINNPSPVAQIDIDAGSTQDIIFGTSTLNSYAEINIQNTNAGNNASTDVVATNDTGNEFGNFIDMGINSTTYAGAGAVGGPSDAYLYTTSSVGELHIGNTSPSATGNVRLFAGGFDSDAFTRIFISSSGNIGFGVSSSLVNKLQIQGNVSASSYTSSVAGSVGYFGTSSWSATSSLALNIPVGTSLTASIGSGSLFNILEMSMAVSGTIAARAGTTTTIDLNKTNFCTVSASGTGTVTWTIINPPAASRAQSFVVEYTNGGAVTNTWFANTRWPGGTAPTLTTGTSPDLLGFVTDDAGNNWRGVLLQRSSA